MAERCYRDQERRKYIRLDSVLPVQFRLMSLDGKQVLSDWQQGFTNNIGKGGIALTVNNLNSDLAEIILARGAKVALDIEIPIARRLLSAQARIIWVQILEKQTHKYLVGLAYELIDPQQNRQIMRYAATKKYLPPLFTAIVIIFGLFVLISGYVTKKLISGNKGLIDHLVAIIQESSIAKQTINEIEKEKEDLQLKMQTLQFRIEAVEEEKSNKDKIKDEEIQQLNASVAKLNQEKSSLQEELIALQNKETKITEEVLDLDKKKATLEKANLDKMYKWLLVHQNPSSGLVISFEGDNELADQAFSYDQALAIQIYTNFSDFSRAKKIINFFAKKAKRIDGRFVNAYYAKDGTPAEYAVRSGPNIWLGIAILQYTHKTQDRSFLDLAKEIASTVMHLQDQEGGVKGGPDVGWYSTEHNLDAYAFFNMLYKVTGQLRYQQARDKILNWLLLHIYDKSEVPIKRGKADSSIATDTYAWTIAALGPEKLQELGMDPEAILEFAEQNCSVEVAYTRPGGQSIKIKGFDFAPQRHLARGGVVSSEWTAQMVLAFKIMEDFYYKKGMVAKAHNYEMKADEYLSQLANMIISSPSPAGQGEGCLAYATQDCVDTGHGWITPKGESTCSVAGTAFALFAHYNYNPLALKE